MVYCALCGAENPVSEREDTISEGPHPEIKTSHFGRNLGAVIIFLFILIASLFLPVIPVTYEVREPYQRTEKYIEKVPMQVEVPIQVMKRTEWAVEWSTLSGDLEWGGTVGSASFAGEFDYSYGSGQIFGSYDDYIGFIATATINVPRSGPISFRIGSDDGSRLLVDGTLVIDNWNRGSYRVKNTVLNLNPGIHSLTFRYYEVTGNARVSFSTDLDVLSWQTTEYQTQTQIQEVEKERVITDYRDVSKNAYVNLFQFLTGQLPND